MSFGVVEERVASPSKGRDQHLIVYAYELGGQPKVGRIEEFEGAFKKDLYDDQKVSLFSRAYGENRLIGAFTARSVAQNIEKIMTAYKLALPKGEEEKRKTGAEEWYKKVVGMGDMISALSDMRPHELLSESKTGGLIQAEYGTHV